MIYKIPIQIENKDPIILGLSLLQLLVLMGFLGIAYLIFDSMQKNGANPTAASIPAIIVAVIGIFMVIFKQYEMTFLPFILFLLRYNINEKQRIWDMGTDSFGILDIGYISEEPKVVQTEIDYEEKRKKLERLQKDAERIL